MANGTLVHAKEYPNGVAALYRNGSGIRRGRFGTEATQFGLLPEQIPEATYPAKLEAFLGHIGQTHPWWPKIVKNTWPDASVQPLSIEESIAALEHGFEGYLKRNGAPSHLVGMSLRRVAGQVVDLNDPIMRLSIINDLNRTLVGGAYIILGHAGCGAVKARLAELDDHQALAHEHSSVRRLVRGITRNIRRQTPSSAEWANAQDQAVRLLHNNEIYEIIKRKKITVIYAVAPTESTLVFNVVHGPVEKDDIPEKFPQLRQLMLQLEKALATARAEDKKLRHAAHVISISKPMDMYRVLNPSQALLMDNSEGYLSVTGICCVDARLRPNTPDSAYYLFRAHLGEIFGATVTQTGENTFRMSGPVLGSVAYALGHVTGVNILAHEGTTGNGHIVALASSMQRAQQIHDGITHHEVIQQALQAGGSITLISFDGNKLSIQNEKIGYEKTITR